MFPKSNFKLIKIFNYLTYEAEFDALSALVYQKSLIRKFHIIFTLLRNLCEFTRENKFKI